ncbi:MAG: SDR family oxidoreductase, partial [Leptospiraceae bacterium]|nr:SDR family oxidoreductase [Leptospiraceae bacterium]
YVGTSNLKGWSVPFEEQSRDTWRDTLEVNLTAPFIMIQAFTKILRESKNSSVINIGSIRGMLGVDMKLYEGTKMGSSIAYSASKGGLLQMTRYLATVLAPDIRVNSISLGGIARNQNELFTKRYIDSTPLGRMGKEEDTKGAAVYLASDLSEYVTGHNLVLDGGWVSW